MEMVKSDTRREPNSDRRGSISVYGYRSDIPRKYSGVLRKEVD